METPPPCRPLDGQTNSCNVCAASKNLPVAATHCCPCFRLIDAATEKSRHALFVRHWAPQYCHCSLDITAPAFHIVGFRNMSEAGASLIVPAVSSPRHRVEVSEFLKSRMEADHDTGSKQTGSGALFDEVGPCVAMIVVGTYTLVVEVGAVRFLP